MAYIAAPVLASRSVVKKGTVASGVVVTRATDAFGGGDMGIASGNQLIAVVYQVFEAGDTSGFTTPSGWSSFASGTVNTNPQRMSYAVYTKTATGSEPATYSFLCTGSGNANASTRALIVNVFRFTGQASSNPVSVTAAFNTAPPVTTATSGSISTGRQNVYFLRFGTGASSDVGNIDVPSPLEELYVDSHDPGLALSVASGTHVLASPGAAGSHVFTSDVEQSNMHGLTIAVFPNPQPAPTIGAQATEKKGTISTTGYTVTPGTDGPSGIVARSLLIAVCSSAQATGSTIPVFSAPAGWSLVGGTQTSDFGNDLCRVTVFKRIAENAPGVGTEPSSYTFTADIDDANGAMIVKLIRIAGHDIVAATPSAITQTTSTSTSLSANRPTTLYDNSLMLYFLSVPNGSDAISPGIATQQWDVFTTGIPENNEQYGGAYTQTSFGTEPSSVVFSTPATPKSVLGMGVAPDQPVFLAPPSVQSAEAFGENQGVGFQPGTHVPESVASAEAFGSPVVRVGYFPSGTMYLDLDAVLVAPRGSVGATYKDAYLDAMLGTNHVSTSPATLHLALFSTLVGDDGSGTEVSASGYARVAIANSDANWEAAAGGLKRNVAQFNFPTAGASWGTPSYWALMDAATLGSVVFWGPIIGSPTVGSGDRFVVPIHTLIVSAV